MWSFFFLFVKIRRKKKKEKKKKKKKKKTCLKHSSNIGPMTAPRNIQKLICEQNPCKHPHLSSNLPIIIIIITLI